MNFENMNFSFGAILGILGIISSVWMYVSKKRDSDVAKTEATELRREVDRDKIEAVREAAACSAKIEGAKEGVMLTQLGAANKGIEVLQATIQRNEELRMTHQMEVVQQITAMQEKIERSKQRLDKIEHSMGLGGGDGRTDEEDPFC